MPARLNSRVSAVILSRGSTWNPLPHDPPYTLPDPGAGWPDGATAQCRFTDNAGLELATVDGVVNSTGITFTAAPDVVDSIPAGANFELFLTVSGDPYQIRYGKVIRREPEFTQQPESVSTPLAFTDSWPTLGIRTTWIQVVPGFVVGDNSGASLPNGIAAVNGAMRWYKPLATDTVAAKITMANQHTYSPSLLTKFRVIVSANTAMTSYLAVEFAASSTGGGTHVDEIHFATGTGPTTVNYQGSAITNVVADGDAYTVQYDDATDTLSVYKGTDTAPLGSWTDTTHLVPHGPGYRYLGFGAITSVGSSGLQATSWQAMDDI